MIGLTFYFVRLFFRLTVVGVMLMLRLMTVMAVLAFRVAVALFKLFAVIAAGIAALIVAACVWLYQRARTGDSNDRRRHTHSPRRAVGFATAAAPLRAAVPARRHDGGSSRLTR